MYVILGNHGLACAFAFRKTETNGTIFLPEKVDKSKLEKLKATGAALKFVKGDQAALQTVFLSFMQNEVPFHN